MNQYRTRVTQRVENFRRTYAAPGPQFQNELRQREPSSSDPNDPQNWPSWRKYLTYVTICLFSFMANVNASAFTIASRPLSQYFRVSLTLATALTALNVLMFGLGNILWVPLMRVVGKRPVFLGAVAVLIAMNAWSARAGTFGSLLAARMLSGLAASAADAPVPSVVGDLFCAERRGLNMMLFHFALASGIFLGPLINAWVLQLHGWRWIPGWMAIVFGVVFLLAVVLVHETEYQGTRSVVSTSHDDHELAVEEDPPLPRRKFFSHLSLSLGLAPRETRFARFWQCLKDIVIMLAYPKIVWSSILVGVFVGWTIIIQITVGTGFTQPPYQWSVGQVGLFHLSGWIGVMLAVLVAGWGVDWTARRAMRRSGAGRPPAEARLIALVVPFLIAPTGLVIFGVCFGARTSWVGPAFGYAMHSFGFAAVSNIVVVYALDSYLECAGEGLVSLFVIRNVIAMFCSLYVEEWVKREGLREMFGVMAAVEWVLLFLGLPMWFFTPKLLELTQRFGPARRVKDKREGVRVQRTKIRAGGRGVRGEDMEV